MTRDKIFVQSFQSYKSVVDDFGKTTDDIENLVTKPEEFKLILFSGGSDVNPLLYGHESPEKLCWYSDTRDTLDTKISTIAIKNNIKMVGICRGLQFLNVIGGGTLLHHINNHEGGIHSFVSPRMSYQIYVNSLHHQMVIPHKDSFIIGSTKKPVATMYFGNHDQLVEDQDIIDIEALYIPHINACGVQYHPEMMDRNTPGFEFFHKLVDEFLYLDDTEFRKAYVFENNKTMCIG